MPTVRAPFRNCRTSSAVMNSNFGLRYFRFLASFRHVSLVQTSRRSACWLRHVNFFWQTEHTTSMPAASVSTFPPLYGDGRPRDLYEERPGHDALLIKHESVHELYILLFLATVASFR